MAKYNPETVASYSRLQSLPVGTPITEPRKGKVSRWWVVKTHPRLELSYGAYMSRLGYSQTVKWFIHFDQAKDIVRTPYEKILPELREPIDESIFWE